MKEIPDRLKGSALIEISSQGESCRPAVKSILKNHRFFKDVHIVYHGYSGETHVFYPGWEAHHQQLKDLGLAPKCHAYLNLQPLETLLLVRVPPDMKAKEGAFIAGLDSMAYPSCNEAGVSSQLSLVEYENTTSAEYLEAFIFYGFLLPLLFFDACRSLVRLFQYTRTCDLRFERLSRVYPDTNRPPPNRWFLWWIGTGISMTKRGYNACIQMPRDQGIAFLMRTIKTHRHLHWIGIWWIGLVIYYVMFALPWWNLILSSDHGLGSYIVRDIYKWQWILWYLLHILILGLTTWSSVDAYPSYALLNRFQLPLFGRCEISFLGLHVLMSSLYLTFLPLMIVICKVYQLKSGVSGKKKKKRE